MKVNCGPGARTIAGQVYTSTGTLIGSSFAVSAGEKDTSTASPGQSLSNGNTYEAWPRSSKPWRKIMEVAFGPAIISKEFVSPSPLRAWFHRLIRCKAPTVLASFCEPFLFLNKRQASLDDLFQQSGGQRLIQRKVNGALGPTVSFELVFQLIDYGRSRE